MSAGMDHEIASAVTVFRQHFDAEDCIDETNIKVIIEKALAQLKRTKVDAYFRSTYSMTYDEFIRSGLDKLAPDKYSGALERVRLISVDADFIFAGFTPDQQPMLLVTHDGQAHIHENFVTIGEGAILASASLISRGHTEIDTLDRALYHVFEAKRYSETVRSVGNSTSMHVFHADGASSLIMPNAMVYLDAAYSVFGPKAVPAAFVIPKEHLISDAAVPEQEQQG
jgi:hypothetical protein